MPSKKKKYNARFPAGRIKKIMQTDEEVGKVAQAVPVIISRTLELFVESLLTKSMQITQSRNAKTLTPSHMKQCILSESRFDFLKDLVKNVPDASAQEDNENNALFEANLREETSEEQSTSTSRSVIQYGPKVRSEARLTSVSRVTAVNKEQSAESPAEANVDVERALEPPIPPLIPLVHNSQASHAEGSLCIDEDYDN